MEEVKKYADTVTFLAKSFDASNRIKVISESIYQCNTEQFHDTCDIIYFPGVLYHLSDPVLALRILFNSLKLGGTILIESAGINIEEPYCKFDGSKIHYSGSKGEMNRGGWNWFLPSPLALERMMIEAGFKETHVLWHEDEKRVYGFGKKISQASICKAGLSITKIK